MDFILAKDLVLILKALTTEDFLQGWSDNQNSYSTLD